MSFEIAEPKTEGRTEGRSPRISALLGFLVSPRNPTRSPYRFAARERSPKGNTGEGGGCVLRCSSQQQYDHCRAERVVASQVSNGSYAQLSTTLPAIDRWCEGPYVFVWCRARHVRLLGARRGRKEQVYVYVALGVGDLRLKQIRPSYAWGIFYARNSPCPIEEFFYDQLLYSKFSITEVERIK
jgi:hypothetical protein